MKRWFMTACLLCSLIGFTSLSFAEDPKDTTTTNTLDAKSGMTETPKPKKPRKKAKAGKRHLIKKHKHSPKTDENK